MKCEKCKQEIEIQKILKMKELGIEVETELHDKGKKLSKIKIPKGWRLLKLNEIIFLFNNYAKQLNMENTWEFFEQPFELNKQNNYVSRFVAYSDGAYLFCFGDASYLDAFLGVRFCRDLKKVKK